MEVGHARTDHGTSSSCRAMLNEYRHAMYDMGDGLSVLKVEKIQHSKA